MISARTSAQGIFRSRNFFLPAMDSVMSHIPENRWNIFRPVVSITIFRVGDCRGVKPRAAPECNAVNSAAVGKPAEPHVYGVGSGEPQAYRGSAPQDGPRQVVGNWLRDERQQKRGGEYTQPAERRGAVSEQSGKRRPYLRFPRSYSAQL